MPAPNSSAAANAIRLFSGNAVPEWSPRCAKPGGPASSGSGPDGDDRVHFDGHAERQDRNPDGAACMTAGFAEHVLHQLRGTVGDFGLVGEGGCAVHEYAEFDHSFDPIERAERGLHLREQHDSATARRSDAAIEVDVFADTAFDE